MTNTIAVGNDQPKLKPDHSQLTKFATALFKHADPAGFVSLRAFYDDVSKPFRIAAVPMGDGIDLVIDIAIGIAAAAANEKRPVVFCPPVATFSNSEHARERDLLQGLALTVECDRHASAAREKLEQLLGPATVVVRSGGKWTNGSGEPEDKLHLHWRWAKPPTGDDLPRAKQARDLAARIVGGDPSNKPTCHPIRWPGSWHRKQEPRLCEIVTLDASREIGLDTALEVLNAAAPPVAASSHTPKKGRGGKKLDADYEALIRDGAPEPERSELFQGVVWHLAHKGMSIDAITDKLAEHPEGIGAKYAGRLRDEVKRSWEKRENQTIRVVGGQLPKIVDAAEKMLLASKYEIYQRGVLVRPAVVPLKASDDRDTEGWRLIPITAPYLVDVLTRCASFVRWDKRSKNYVSIDAPDKVAQTYLARAGEWKAPVLAGIVNTPFLRVDGSICQTAGYDAASGLLFRPGAQKFPPIPQRPSKDEARAALAKLREPIALFPFVTDADEAVALSGMLTALDRSALPSAPPVHGYDATAAGSGKSKLVDIASVLATGCYAAVIAQGATEEELEKRLGAELLTGSNMIAIDNCSLPLESAFLNAMLTQPRVKVRILRKSVQPELPSNALVCATGNGLTFVGDLTRRCLRCSLDAEVERPELRRFAFDPVGMALARRAELVVAGLTVLRAHWVSGERVAVKAFGSFEVWSRRVREALVWLGCADPLETMEQMREKDPDRSALVAVLAQWKEHIAPYTAVTTADVIRCATSSVVNEDGTRSARREFRTALLNVAGDRGGIDNRRLGIWLAAREYRIVNRMQLVPRGTRHGSKMWALHPA
jgi:hypothetical protein